MNIVFYTLLALGLFMVYFALSSLFGFIGDMAIKMFNRFKRNLLDEGDGESNEG